MSVQPPDYDALVHQSSEELEASRGFKASLTVAPVVGGIVGAVVGLLAVNGPFGLAGVVPGALLGFGIPWMVAAIRSRQIATQRFFAAWAQQHGLTFDPHPPVYDDTPLLRAGDDQFAHNSFAGTLAGRPGSIYTHTKRVRRTTTDSKGNTTTTNDDTDFVVLRLAFSLAGFARFQLHPRSFGEVRLLDGLESKLTSNRVVELESEELAHDFKLEVDDGVDEITLRRLFTPDAIVEVLQSRGSKTFHDGIAFEVERSTLVFYRQGSIGPRSMGAVEAMIAEAAPFVAWLEGFAGMGSTDELRARGDSADTTRDAP
jgi:hypothetical protein